MPKRISWFHYFSFVHCTWVFFRATTFDNAIKVYKECLDFPASSPPEGLQKIVTGLGFEGLMFGKVLARISGGTTPVFMLLIWGSVAIFA
ncbi:MAG: hypothetical protein R2864_00055 [Syntrophotaleaceae bacterium]